MTLNASGPISIGGSTAGQSINLELSRAATATSNLNEAALRNLAGVASGTISLSNFYGKSGDLLSGYFVAGTSFSTEIDGINFSNEAAINPAATAPVAKQYSAGLSSYSTQKGYICGGYISTGRTASIEGLNFSTSAAIDPAAALPVSRYSTTGLSSYNTLKGYCGGGWTTTYSAEIDGLDFSTEAAINPAAVLAVARYGTAGLSSSGTSKGYFCGGYRSTGDSTEIDGIDFSTEAAINPAATLAAARTYAAGVSSSTYSRGYVAGGSNSSGGLFYDNITRLDFSTEARTAISAVLSVAREGAAGTSSTSTNKGYFGGGHIVDGVPDDIYYADIDGINFATEAAINPSATLITAREGAAGMTTSGV